MKYSVGDQVKVEDKGKHYDARIVETKGKEVKIHWKGYSARRDLWLSEDSERFQGDSDDEFADAAEDGETETLPPQHHPGNNRVTPDQGMSHSGVLRSVSNVCHLCQGELGNEVVSCGDCSLKFHAEKICLGVEEDVIRVLLRESGGAIKYVCCICRNGKGETEQLGKDGAIPQMLGMIGG